jgi:ATP-binding cassette, subfamily B, bacterial
MKERSNYWSLLPYASGYWRSLGLGLLGVLGYVALTLMLPKLAEQVSTAIAQGQVKSILDLVVITAIVFLLRGACQSLQDIGMAHAALGMTLDIRTRAYTHLHKLGLNYVERVPTGELAYRLTTDVDRIGEIVKLLAHQAVPCFLQLLAIPIYMIYLNWQLTLATVILAPLMAILVGWFGDRLMAVARRSQNRASNLAAIVTESLGGMRLIQAFAAEDYEIRRFKQEAELTRQSKFLEEKLKAIQVPVAGFLQAICILLLFLIGGWQISQRNLTGGEFVAFLTAVVILIQPIDLFIRVFNEFKQTEASVDRVFELLAVQPSIMESPHAQPLPQLKGEVEYRQVSFAYQPGQRVLQNLNLHVKPGEVIALVGASGAGKTTLMNLLLRFYDPTEGQVFVDGYPLIDVTLTSLRRQIGVVLQDNILFSGTIAQNIAFGQATLNERAVVAAAKIANAHGFIDPLPEGYQTWVGERGVNLSGGQRQRIAIARAVLLDPPILVLDEATSALDSESEALIQEALERLMQNRTVFIIAHRLSTVRRASRIIVLEKGEIVEMGNHEQLIALQGRYSQFYAQQFH